MRNDEHVELIKNKIDPVLLIAFLRHNTDPALPELVCVLILQTVLTKYFVENPGEVSLCFHKNDFIRHYHCGVVLRRAYDTVFFTPFLLDSNALNQIAIQLDKEEIINRLLSVFLTDLNYIQSVFAENEMALLEEAETRHRQMLQNEEQEYRHALSVKLLTETESFGRNTIKLEDEIEKSAFFSAGAMRLEENKNREQIRALFLLGLAEYTKRTTIENAEQTEKLNDFSEITMGYFQELYEKQVSMLAALFSFAQSGFLDRRDIESAELEARTNLALSQKRDYGHLLRNKFISREGDDRSGVLDGELKERSVIETDFFTKRAEAKRQAEIRMRGEVEQRKNAEMQKMLEAGKIFSDFFELSPEAFLQSRQVNFSDLSKKNNDVKFLIQVGKKKVVMDYNELYQALNIEYGHLYQKAPFFLKGQPTCDKSITDHFVDNRYGKKEDFQMLNSAQKLWLAMDYAAKNNTRTREAWLTLKERYLNLKTTVKFAADRGNAGPAA